MAWDRWRPPASPAQLRTPRRPGPTRRPRPSPATGRPAAPARPPPWSAPAPPGRGAHDRADPTRVPHHRGQQRRALGFTSGSSFTDREAYDALVADVNAHGGLAGRKIIPVYGTTDTASSNWSSQFQGRVHQPHAGPQGGRRPRLRVHLPRQLRAVPAQGGRAPSVRRVPTGRHRSAEGVPERRVGRPPDDRHRRTSPPSRAQSRPVAAHVGDQARDHERRLRRAATAPSRGRWRRTSRRSTSPTTW